MLASNTHVGGTWLAGPRTPIFIYWCPNSRRVGGKGRGRVRLDDSKGPSAFEEPPPTQGGTKRRGKKRSSGKKVVMTLLTESTDVGSYSVDIGPKRGEDLRKGWYTSLGPEIFCNLGVNILHEGSA